VKDCWHVYFLRTRRSALYAGITNDVKRRVNAHETGRGAKALRARGPLRLVYQAEIGSRALALRVERRLKRLSKARKEEIVAAQLDAAALRARLGV
jgi:putative endonuclease